MAFLLTVKRDTQKERTTKSRNSWGAEAVRVQVEQPVLHEPTVISQWGTAGAPAILFRNPLIGSLVRNPDLQKAQVRNPDLVVGA